MRVRLFLLALSVALSAVCLPGPGLAQTTFGTILGTVTDPSGAVMPNVTITVTNEGENISHNVTSDAQGNYQAENLKAGQYTVTAQVSGFKEVTVRDILLIARQTVRVDFKLVMGTAAEQVTVVANPELINTESQTISSSFDSNEVLDLPANYRGAGSTSPYALLAYLPGVTGDGSGSITVQGAGTNQVEYSMDGISTTNIRFAGPQTEMFPSAESIAEMKVQGSGGGAEYGNPADITTTSKSGTNVFHGSAFEYFQNKALDATRFTVPQVVKPAKSANDFGGSFGGPLWGKRTFFFGDYEAMRFRTQTVQFNTVPSQAMRDGDFSSLLPGTIIHDVDGTPFPGNKIPTGSLDPRAALILQFYPLPNQGGVNNFAFDNYATNVPNPILSDQFDIRIDHTINTKQSVFER